jgi:ketosteroid isomerase-like protein
VTIRELVERHIEAGNQFDFDRLESLSAADLVMDMSRSIRTDRGVYRGFDEVRAFLDSYAEAFESVIATPVGFYERGDWIAVEMAVRFRGRGSGVDLEAQGARVYEAKDGKVTRYVQFQDMAAAREFVDSQP